MGDSDHSGGLLDVFKYYKVDKFFSNGDLSKEVEQKYYSIKLATFDVIKTNMIEFEIVNLAKKTKIGGNENEKSIAGILSYRDIKIFMAGDITADVEKRLVWQGILKEPVDVLKVNHHGSKEANSEELLEI